MRSKVQERKLEEQGVKGKAEESEWIKWKERGQGVITRMSNPAKLTSEAPMQKKGGGGGKLNCRIIYE